MSLIHSYVGHMCILLSQLVSKAIFYQQLYYNSEHVAFH